MSTTGSMTWFLVPGRPCAFRCLAFESNPSVNFSSRYFLTIGLVRDNSSSYSFLILLNVTSSLSLIRLDGCLDRNCEDIVVDHVSQSPSALTMFIAPLCAVMLAPNGLSMSGLIVFKVSSTGVPLFLVTL